MPFRDLVMLWLPFVHQLAQDPRPDRIWQLSQLSASKKNDKNDGWMVVEHDSTSKKLVLNAQKLWFEFKLTQNVGNTVFKHKIANEMMVLK